MWCGNRGQALPAKLLRSEVELHQQARVALIGLEVLTVPDPVLVRPIVVLDTHIQLLLANVQRFAQVVFDLRVEVQVGVVGAFAVLVVVDHPVHEAIDQDVRIAHRNGVGPDRGDLPDVVTRAAAFGVTLVEVQLEVVETRNRQVETRTDQVRLGIAFTELVRHGQQHVLDRAELQFLVEDFAKRQARADFAVVGVRTDAGVVLAVVENLVDEHEVVAVFPCIGVLESDGLLNARVDLEVLAIEVGQAVVLPLQQVAGHGLAPGQQGSREHQTGARTFHSVAPKK
ncbi:MutT-like protein [Priestia megaterium]